MYEDTKIEENYLSLDDLGTILKRLSEELPSKINHLLIHYGMA